MSILHHRCSNECFWLFVPYTNLVVVTCGVRGQGYPEKEDGILVILLGRPENPESLAPSDLIHTYNGR